MLDFKLTPLGKEILFKYCSRNPLLEVWIINEPDGEKGFMVRRKKTKGFVYIYNKFKFGKLFIVKKDEKIKGLVSDDEDSNKEQSEEFYLYPDTNLIYELEIEELNELVDIMELCRDKSEDD